MADFARINLDLDGLPAERIGNDEQRPSLETHGITALVGDHVRLVVAEGQRREIAGAHEGVITEKFVERSGAAGAKVRIAGGHHAGEKRAPLWVFGGLTCCEASSLSVARSRVGTARFQGEPSDDINNEEANLELPCHAPPGQHEPSDGS